MSAIVKHKGREMDIDHAISNKIQENPHPFSPVLATTFMVGRIVELLYTKKVIDKTDVENLLGCGYEVFE